MAMRLHRRAAVALRALLRRSTVERELDDELRFHFDQMAQHAADRGADTDGAYREARRRFGGMNQVKEACRDMRTLRPIEHFFQDLRFGSRLLARSPVFTVVAVLSLALGIGANSAIFSVINAVVLRKLPVAAPDELLLAQASYRDESSQRFSYPVVVGLQEALRGRAEVCAQSSVQPVQVAVTAGAGLARPESGQLQMFSGGCFAVLRQQAQLGRLLGPEDDVVSAPRAVAVISDSYWSRRFGRSPAAVGSDLVVNGTPLTIVGVTAPAFFGTAIESRTPDLWAPVLMQAPLRYAGNVSNSNGDTHKPWVSQRELSWLTVMLRVPEEQAAAAAAAFNVVAQQDFRQRAEYSSSDDYRERVRATQITLLPGAHGFSGMRARVRTPLLVLLAMVGLVLAVACANLASLLLARGTHRNREMAVRLAIGAGRGRLIRQLLTESLLLALLGGIGGLLAADWGSTALVRLGDGGAATLSVDVRPDWRVLVFTLAVSVLTGLLFGLLPAIRATRVSLTETMKAHARSVAGAGKSSASASRLLVAGQMAFSLLLLIVAALFGRSLQELMRTDVGFDRRHLLVARLDPQAAGYELKDLPELHRRILDRVRALPGVTSASLSGNGPFSGSRTTSGFEVQGHVRGRDERLRTQEDVVTPGYFETVGLRIVKGRGFEPADVAGGRNVSVVNETFARRYLGGQDPIGRRWSYDTDFGANAFEIVGVVSDARYNDLKADSLNMTYRPAAQSDWYLESLEVQAAGEPAALTSTVQAALREAEPRLPIARVEALDARVSRSMGQERMLTWLTATFGLVALALACLGLYGTISYAVTRRTAELGVRMALGADRSAVRWLIMREALVLVLIGLGAGVPLALLSATALKGILFNVSSLDVASYAAAAVVLMAIATLAAYLPARRASRLDPVAALRAE